MLPELSVIIVSYNTLEMTLKAVDTLYQHTSDIDLQVIVWDNASEDGSAEAIAKAFPTVELVAHDQNIGFAAANNRAAGHALGEWLLLLNSDTEVLPGAIQELLNFAKSNPNAGIVGGKTVFADGSLNPTSCFNRMTLWSLFCNATGLTKVLAGNSLFDPERLDGAKLDQIRKVDIVTGCFFLLKTELWKALGGFDLRYFMYAEETDLCLRAGKIGYRPMITPKATIIHHGGASAISSAVKQQQSYTGRATIIRDHFSSLRQPLGLAMLWLTVLTRHTGHSLLALVGRAQPEKRNKWRAVWERRDEWLKGY